MHPKETNEGKINLSNYSYLEERFYSQNKQLSQFCHLNENTIADVSSLLEEQSARVIISHSSLHSQFFNLTTILQKKFKNTIVFDFANIQEFEKIRQLSFKEEQEETLLIVSGFGLRYQRYAPPLITLIQKVSHKSNVKFFIYCDSTQQNSILKLSENNQSQFFVIDFSIARPYEISSGNVLEELKKFLVEESKQAKKLDVVLFHPKTENLIRDISHMLKIEGITATSQLVFEGGKILNEDLSNVIIVNNTETLRQWNYNLSSVYLVLDSGKQSRLYFNYDYMSFVEDEVVIDKEESVRRMNLISSRLGQYIIDEQNMDIIVSEETINAEYTDIYCLGLGYFGISDKEAMKIKNVKYCIDVLKANKILIQEQNRLKIVNENIYCMAIQGMNPIFANMFMDKSISKKYLHSLILLYSIMISPSLRPFKQQYRPSGVWRKSGYLHSCLDLMTKVKSLQDSQQSKPIQSDDEQGFFSLKSLAEKYTFNIPVYEYIQQQNRRMHNILNIEFKDSYQALEDEQFNQVLQILITHLRGGVAFNSGSRRLGYFQKGKQFGLLPHHQCLMRLLNERPSFILITRLMVEEQQIVIGNCNYIEDEVIISAYGAIPVTSKQSFGECEIEFHNISGSIFAHLSKYNSLQIQNFERQHQCSVELNQEISTISVQCSKLKQNSLRQTFSKLIQEIKQTYQKQARIVNYSNTMKVIIGSGGQIKQLSVKEGNQQELIQDTCLVKNLDPEVQLADLKDLFDEFVQIKDIKVINLRNQNEAIITFYSYEDYKTFYSYFQGCIYLGRSMSLNPYVPKIVQVLPEKYLLFEWNHWKSQREANILMQNEFAARKVFKCLCQLGYKAQQNEEKVSVSGLSGVTDERDIQLMIIGCGKMKQIEVMRYYSKQSQDDHVIERIINESFKGDDVKYTCEAVNKGKNGYRSKKVKFEKDNVMKEAYFLMNEIVGRIGTGKLYATPVFTYPVKLPNDEQYIPVYEEIIQQVSQDINRLRPIATQVINERDTKFIIVKANEDAEVDLIVNFLSQKLQGTELNINIEDKSLLFTEMAMKKIINLQKKFVCKFTFEFIEKKIKVLTRTKNIGFIEKQINTKLVEQFVYPIPVYVNAFRYLKNNFQQIKKNNPIFNNVKTEFEAIAKTIILTGRIEHIEKAKNQIERLVKSMRKKSQSMEQSEEYCALCCEEFAHPFKLQSCGHKFCFDCLQSTVRMTLKDLSMYPIKCPECLEKILVSDLNCLCDEKDWKQIVKMSVNHFVYTHPSEYSFCYTVSCPQINVIEGNWFRCRECKKGYCLSCKANYHPGMSCEQNRYGSDRMFKQYMNQIGGRVCANKVCKAPIVRIDGCFKVQCTRCKKCMCFKCPQNLMVAYDTPAQTYQHLDKKHGGCF